MITDPEESPPPDPIRREPPCPYVLRPAESTMSPAVALDFEDFANESPVTIFTDPVDARDAPENTSTIPLDDRGSITAELYIDMEPLDPLTLDPLLIRT